MGEIMYKFVSKLAVTTCLAAGALLLTGGSADATGGKTNAAAARVDNVVHADAQAPITLCGIVIALLGDTTVSLALVGDAAGTCSAAPAGPASAPAAATGIPRGNVADIELSVPITICGIAVSLGGDATGSCPTG